MCMQHRNTNQNLIFIFIASNQTPNVQQILESMYSSWLLNMVKVENIFPTWTKYLFFNFITFITSHSSYLISLFFSLSFFFVHYHNARTDSSFYILYSFLMNCHNFDPKLLLSVFEWKSNYIFSLSVEFLSSFILEMPIRLVLKLYLKRKMIIYWWKRQWIILTLFVCHPKQELLNMYNFWT